MAKKLESPPADAYKIELTQPDEVQNDADLNYKGDLSAPYPEWLEEAITEGRVYTPGLNRADLRKPSYAKTREGDVALVPGCTIAPDGDSYFVKAWTESEWNVDFEGGDKAAPSQQDRTVEDVRGDPQRMKLGQGDTSIQGAQSPPSVPSPKQTTKDLPQTGASKAQDKAIRESNEKVEAAARKREDDGNPGLSALNRR